MNPSAAAADQVDSSPRPTRFTYGSGDRPLEGYTIKRGVGSGGFGEVYFAVSDAGKEVALKLIRRNLEVELRGVRECLNLKHANLVDLYDIRTDDRDDQWVVMEYVSGASLEDVIARHPDGMPEDMAVAWFRGIASAVVYLHDRGIVHRDLKPGNIFIDDGTVKIGDYGLAKFISCSRRSGQTESVGTVHYMAPEIANGRYGREIDTYALGIIFYEMLTGHVPFEGESVGEVLMKHLTAEPDLSGLAEPYQQIVRGAMAKDPDQRIDSFEDLLALLPAPAGGEAREGTYREADPWSHDAPGRDRARRDRQWASTGSHRNRWHADDAEPIAAGLQQAWDNVYDGLQIDRWHPLGRVFGAFVALLFLAVTAEIWLPLLLTFGVFYAIYRVVRALFFLPPGGRPDSPGPRGDTSASAGEGPFDDDVKLTRIATATEEPPRRRAWRRRRQTDWRKVAMEELSQKSYRERGRQLLGSMLLAAIVSVFSALIANFFMGSNFDAPLFVWMAIVGTTLCWAVMIPVQLVEGRLEDYAPLRFTLLLVGLFVGIVAFLAAQGLYLPLPASDQWAPRPDDTIFSEFFQWRDAGLRSGYQNGSVRLPLPWFAGYFALLLGVVRWQRFAGLTRSTRISLWSIAWCSLVAWLITFLCWFPMPLGVILVAMTAFTVQFSSPWLAPSRRRELAEAAAAETMV